MTARGTASRAGTVSTRRGRRRRSSPSALRFAGGGGCNAARLAPDVFVIKAEGGDQILVVVGSEGEIACTSAALEQLAGAARRFPRLLEYGNDARHGSFLALTAPVAGASRLEGAAAALTVADGATFLRGLLDSAAALERAGFAWEPEPFDVQVHGACGPTLRASVGAATARERWSAWTRSACSRSWGPCFLPRPSYGARPHSCACSCRIDS